MPEILNIQEICEQIATLDDEIARLKELVKTRDKQRTELEQLVVASILNGNKFQSASFAGGRTVYKSVIIRPTPKRSRLDLVQALKVAGPEWASLVKEDYNANTLWHHTNELRDVALTVIPPQERAAFDMSTLIPDVLRDDLTFDTTIEIRSRRGST